MSFDPMATNGESAALWLAENTSHLSRQRIEQVRNNVFQKLEVLNEDHPDAPGLLEALEVLDQHLESDAEPQNMPAPPAPPSSPSDSISESAGLDLSPLIPEQSEANPLDPDEKRARFQELLAQSRTS
ncbi:hypothetical protein MIB92_13945 [Aestuariirhabdus sp. Z084]|uniref:hypothetical protein n=1 Tax=Aestuariirhabdus haliotis TaxID=2918751 RepID=UPI00201B3729|nr:hypothetical protein [Aestuariirhabdus haliotis]MCL6416758.1 hypothetical protein [Aestuariirhabdus haliotis]MCL6420777.1 hypothetical protein [Aestuariirhabdus haliotis]